MRLTREELKRKVVKQQKHRLKERQIKQQDGRENENGEQVGTLMLKNQNVRGWSKGEGWKRSLDDGSRDERRVGASKEKILDDELFSIDTMHNDKVKGATTVLKNGVMVRENVRGVKGTKEKGQESAKAC